MISIKECLARHAVGSNRAWADDRSQTVGASEVGQCLRKTWFVKHEHEPTFGIARDDTYEESWGATKRGSVYEDNFWAPGLAASLPAPATLVMAGEDQRTLFSGYLSATPDGLVINAPRDALAHLGVADIGSDCFSVECKTVDPRVAADKLPKPENVFQVHVQLGLIRERTNYAPNYGVITYTDASWWDQMFEFVVEFDPAIYTEAKARAARILTTEDPFDLPPEGEIAGSRECKYCPFSRTCRGVDAKAAVGGRSSDDPEVVEDVHALVFDLATAKAEEKQASERRKELEHDLKARLRAHGVQRVAGDGFSVNWSAVKGRPSWDTKGLREAAIAAGVDVSRFETTGDPTDRLTVTIKDR